LLDQGNTRWRQPLRGIEQQVERKSEARSTALAAAIDFLHQANVTAPNHPPVHRALAEHFVERLLDAEAGGDLASAAAARPRAGSTTMAATARCSPAKALVSSPPIRRRWWCGRSSRRFDRTDAAGGEEIALGPGQARSLTHGRYLVANDSGVNAAYRFERGKHYTIGLPSKPILPAQVAYIPAGTVYSSGGQAIAQVRHFAIARLEVTCGEYLEFLNDQVVHQKYDAARLNFNLIYAPRASFRRQGTAVAPARGVGLEQEQRQLPARDRQRRGREAIEPKRPLAGVSLRRRGGLRAVACQSRPAALAPAADETRSGSSPPRAAMAAPIRGATAPT